MTFDINSPATDPETGEYDERAAMAYQDALLEQFAASPEGRAYTEQGNEIGWSSMFLDYAVRYIGVNPPEMEAGHFDEVLFELFPRKVSVEPAEAPDIVAELRAFWAFLDRAYGLPNAATMLSRLDDGGARRLERELADPANYGMAKSIVMQGKAAGFDTTTPEGLETWMHAYNAGLGAPPPLRAGPLDDLRLPPPAQRSGSKASKEKNRRKMAKASRKQNRRK